MSCLNFKRVESPPAYIGHAKIASNGATVPIDCLDDLFGMLAILYFKCVRRRENHEPLSA